MPDDIGVRVWRYEYTDTPSGARGYMYEDSPNRDPYDVDPADPGLEPGRWFPEAYAAALVDLANAVPYRIGNLSTAEAKRIIAILDRLAALGLDPS